ncbi:GAF domain-containing protein [Polyangium sp. 15x6]|uniref:GAF domain-containing protein n=1 Tax=Polyangium sp. 15x6 TaxID=3042687 RepID=UPI0032B5CC07
MRKCLDRPMNRRRADRLLFAGDARAVPLLQQYNVHAYIRVPLLARERCLGVMFLLATAPQRHYGPADLALAEELGRRAATRPRTSRQRGSRRCSRSFIGRWRGSGIWSTSCSTSRGCTADG